MIFVGYDKPLYTLPFDHGSSFQKRMFGWDGDLSPQQTAEVVAAKRVIYDAFKAAIQAGVPKDKAGIVVDEQFGAAILRDAAAEGFTTCCPAEKRGQDEFEFEYGSKFEQHIEAIQPAFCKVQVRYNPEGDHDLNQRQLFHLRLLSEYLHGAYTGHSRFMLELLVPPEEAQLERLKGDRKAYHLQLRPRLMAQAIQQLQDAGVEPDVWAVEGLDRREDCERIVAAARRQTRGKVSCMVVGRGENDETVRGWLTIAAEVPGFIGFAAGWTTFGDPLVNWRAKKVTRDGAVAEIARRYRQCVKIFETSEKAVPA